MSARTYEFANFRIDVADCALLQDGRPVPLTPKAFDTLLLLVESRGRLLEKEVMMERLWPGTFVEEANLANNISLLRKALGESANAIQTVPRRGYRFVAEVQEGGGEETVTGEKAVAGRPRARFLPIALTAAAVLMFATLAFFGGRVSARREPVSFRQVTFRRGAVTGARISGDGNIVYSAVHEGRPAELFVTRADQKESRALGIVAHLLSVSPHGDLAILTNAPFDGFVLRGTLARVALTGGAPRELATNVQDADWSPDGAVLAVIRWYGSQARVEYPLGRTLFAVEPPGWVSTVRIGPRGDSVAFLLHESQRFDDRGRVVIVDRKGRQTATSRVFTSASGLAWHGDELWLSASPDDLNNALYAVDRRGADRLLTRAPGRLTLFDTADGGRALVTREVTRIGMIAGTPGGGERELSWLDGSWLRDVSADGRTLLFDEEVTGGGSTGRVYLRTIDGAPAVELGDGHAVALSPDGKWALTRQRFARPPRLVRIPTGAGEPAVVPTGRVEPAERAAWLHDGRSILLVGNEPHRPPRDFLVDPATGALRPVTPEGVTGTVVSADDQLVVARRPRSEWLALPLAGGQGHPVPGLTPADIPMRFSDDSRSLIAIEPGNVIVRVDLGRGRRERIATYGIGRPPDCVYLAPAYVAANGNAYAYTYASVTSELYVVGGIP